MCETFTCIVYVDYIILWDRNEDDIHNLAMHLRDLGDDLEQEYDNAGFLGVTLEQEINTGLLDMKQTGLIPRVIEAIGLEDGMGKGKFTPSEQRPLVKDAYGKPPSRMFRYIIIVGMLLYLSGNTCPYMDFTVN